MDITVYLPDDVGRQAKAAELPFSQLLRSAIVSELERRRFMDENSGVFELPLEDEEGRRYVGRFLGAQIGNHPRNDVEAYLADDGRVLMYDRNQGVIADVSEHAADSLRVAFDDEDYIAAMEAIGEEAVVNI